MALDAKYSPQDIRNVISVGLEPMAHRVLEWGIQDTPGYYQNDNVLVLDAATDTIKPKVQMLQTIDTAFDSLRGLSEKDKQRKIIIPVSEEQKILGIFPRNHWVTVYYDPAINKVTLLDSRPWIMSFLYPDTSMRKLLHIGLTKTYGAEIANKTRFKVCYQDVQHNDTFCGAWTGKNIRDLAGVDAQGKCNSIAEQMVAYTADHEENIIAFNTQIATNQPVTININKIPTGLFQRFLNAIGLGQTDTVDHTPVIPQIDNAPKMTNLAKATQQLCTDKVSTHLANEEWEMVDDEVKIVDGNVIADNTELIVENDVVPEGDVESPGYNQRF